MKRRVRIFVSGSTDAHISEEYYKTAIAFGKMLDMEKHDIIFDGCNGVPGVVASQIGKPNDNLEISYTMSNSSSSQICNNWPYARRNGDFRYQSEVTRA